MRLTCRFVDLDLSQMFDIELKNFWVFQRFDIEFGGLEKFWAVQRSDIKLYGFEKFWDVSSLNIVVICLFGEGRRAKTVSTSSLFF